MPVPGRKVGTSLYREGFGTVQRVGTPGPTFEP